MSAEVVERQVKPGLSLVDHLSMENPTGRSPGHVDYDYEGDMAGKGAQWL